MKIARIESFIFGTKSSKDLLFCRVETEDGTYGWGEGYVTAGKETVIAECLRAMAPHVIGRGVFNIRHTGQIMFEDFAIRRGSMELLSAWSAIEIASWDIIGKRAGLPVYNLLGGASRERVRVYANGWAGRSTIADGVERALKVKAMGFTAAKFDPFPGPWRSHVDRKDEDFAIQYVREMRAAVGPDFEILVEAHRRFAPSHAIRIGHRLAEFNIDWYEEPCLADNLTLLAEVRHAVPIPIVTGEALYTKEQFFRVPGDARRRHPQPRYLRDRRHLGIDGYFCDGAAAGRRHVAAQLQLAARRHGGDRARLGGHPELSHHRIFRQFRGHLPRHRNPGAERQGRLDRPANGARPRHRHRCREIARPPAPGSLKTRLPTVLGRIPAQGLRTETVIHELQDCPGVRTRDL